MQRWKGGAKRVQPVSRRQAMGIYNRLRGEDKHRDALLWALGITTGLRISDLLKLRVEDLLDADEQAADSVEVRETKTGKTRGIRILSLAKAAYEDYRRTVKPLDTDPLFPSRSGDGAITREQARRLVKKWCAESNLRGNYGTHTMRKTFATIAYESSGHDPVATARITGHSNPSQLLRYIGQAPRTEQVILGAMDRSFGS